MNKESFTAIDFETSNSQYMACQVGLVVVENGVIVHRLSRLIQPPFNDYNPHTIAVHHITPDKTIDAPTFDIVWDEIRPYLTNTTIVAHNASFDEKVLYKNLDFYGIMAIGINPFVCTCDLFMRASLKDLCKAFNMPLDNHHDALFDAECCAKFYLNYLRGVRPMFSIADKPVKVRREKNLTGDILVKDLSKANPKNPFYDRKVVITGEFMIPRRTLAEKLKLMGADIDTSISKKTNFVIVGSDPGPAKMEKIDKLRHDGFNIRLLSEDDINSIFDGNWEPFLIDKEVMKDLSLTYEHYVQHHLCFENGRNIIASKELFYGKAFRGNFDLFNQITGNLGAFGDLAIYPETNICVLSDSTVYDLQHGRKDDTIKYIEDYYNKNKTIVFDFDFLSESDILQFCKERCESCGDELTMGLYRKYIDSIK